MLTITTEQARTRFITLPPTLQDAVFSEQTAEIIASTIEKFNLADHRAEDIPTLVGWVLLGFLHIEDLATEIETTARVPKPLAKEIADSLTIKIFEPLRGALAQFHAPVPDAMNGVVTAPVRINIEGMSAAPKIISGTTFTATPGSQKDVIIGPKVIQEVKPIVSGANQGIKPSEIGKPIPHFEQKPNIGGAMAAQTTPAQKPKSGGEFARLASQQQGNGTPTPPAAPVKPLVPVATQAPKPMMLQNSSLPRPIQNAPDLNNPQRAIDILSGKKMPVPLAIKPATIEIGGVQKATNTPVVGPITTPKVINYGTQNSSAATQNRQITEITAAPATLPVTPKPPDQQPTAVPIKPIGLTPIKTMQAPPMPPTPQMPPVKTQISGEKVIVKNFKEGE